MMVATMRRESKKAREMEIRIEAYISEDGELTAKVPQGVPPGKIDIILLTPDTSAEEAATTEEPTWTDEEIRDMLRPEPKTGKEIVEAGHTGGWEHYGITDSVAWVQEQRRKRREKRGW